MSPVRPLLVAGTAFGLAALTAFACTTPDPRAGTNGASTSSGTGPSSSSSSSSSSTSGGVDAEAVSNAVACGAQPGAAAGTFDKRALLGAAAACAQWNACTFQNAATALRDAVRKGAVDESRSAWKAAMLAQSKMELFRFGPAGTRSTDPYHGRGLRTFVHSWPDANRCQVEAQIASKDWQKGMGTVLPSARGLFAVEYALFYPGVDTACLPGSATGLAWGAIADLPTAKSAYATAVAENVLAVAVELRNVWLPPPGGEGFDAKLLAFDGYGSEQETLTVVGWSLLYVEEELKDIKLAPRAKIVETPPNPETPFAHVEIEAVRANLRAFRMLFQGCGSDGVGLGFDDWLVAAGQGALAQEILAALANAQTAADAFPSFEVASVDQTKAFYEVVRVLCTLLKTRLFGPGSVLGLKLPAGVVSDTD